MYTQHVSGLQPAVTRETLSTLLDYKPLHAALSHTRLTGKTSLQWKKSPSYIPLISVWTSINNKTNQHELFSALETQITQEPDVPLWYTQTQNTLELFTPENRREEMQQDP